MPQKWAHPANSNARKKVQQQYKQPKSRYTHPLPPTRCSLTSVVHEGPIYPFSKPTILLYYYFSWFHYYCLQMRRRCKKRQRMEEKRQLDNKKKGESNLEISLIPFFAFRPTIRRQIDMTILMQANNLFFHIAYVSFLGSTVPECELLFQFWKVESTRS